jgi:uncharacterized protein YwgA
MSEISRKIMGNDDLVRLILWFCGTKVQGEATLTKEFKSVTKLQKLIFLAQKEADDFLQLQNSGVYVDQPFNFSADNFGPFSVDLTKLLAKMNREKEIEIDKNGTSTCFRTKESLKQKLSEIKEVINTNQNLVNLINVLYNASKLSLDQLLKYVYQNPKYDEYLVNSVIKNKYV